MPPDVFAYILQLGHRNALLKRMKDTRKAQAQYKKKYNRHVRFKPSFETGGYVFVERPLLLASAADRMGWEGHSKLVVRRTVPHRVISIGS